MTIIKENINKIILGDCTEKLKQFPDNSIDLIFADPPYNLQLQKDLFRQNGKKFEGVEDEWDKFESFEEYDKFCFEWLKECKRVLKDDGTIWVIGSFHNIFRVGKIIQDLNYWILNDILWIKINPVPNFKGTRFNNAHETLIWASKNKNSKYTFNYKTMKAYNCDRQMRSDWNIPIVQGKARIKDKSGNKAHSTQKPNALLYRIILSTTKKGDLILDPFMGSGTTGAVAKILKRNFIGIEKEKKYVEIATKRIEKIYSRDDELVRHYLEEKPPRVPFANLIEARKIKIGEKLYSKNKKFYGIVMADTTIKNTIGVGSIHSLSAKMLNKESNNGWKFWYVERKNNLISIDDLRQEYIKEYLEDY